jgi:hypothetical protein
MAVSLHTPSLKILRYFIQNLIDDTMPMDERTISYSFIQSTFPIILKKKDNTQNIET